jgi:2-polyprenyl-6-hydroxyphenyl methylase/3-demethylubiquinone-9 3-methyltransferase
MTKPCKICGSESIEKYEITWDFPVTVYECKKCGLHFLDILDEEQLPSKENDCTISDKEKTYIRDKLQGNKYRFSWQLGLLNDFLPKSDASILDIGAGGGVFLHLAAQNGFHTFGSEPNDVRRKFAQSEYGLALNREVVEHPFWDRYAGSFDAITLWDVIEHVNDPRGLIVRCAELLRPGGFLLMDTPERNSVFYRSGEWSYKLSKGRYPFLLKTMYSPEKFGHKQIFRIFEMKRLLNLSNFDVIFARRFHELSFPHEFYLRRLLRNGAAIKVALPFTKALIRVLPVKNKMMIVAQTRGEEKRPNARPA